MVIITKRPPPKHQTKADPPSVAHPEHLHCHPTPCAR